MWFLSARQARRTPPARSQRNSFRPELEAMEDRCLMSAGALDLTFGSGGMVSGGAIHFAQTVVVQPNGKIVVGGEYFNASNYAFWGLGRYNANGTLDTTFGNNGVVGLGSASFGPSVTRLALQSDGKIVAVGYAPSTYQIEVARFNSNGSLDTTFGGGKKPTGFVVTTVSNSSDYVVPTDVVIQADGKIDVAVANPVANSAIYLVRYNANGTVDTTFGPSHNGIVKTPNANASSMALQSDGKILLAGSSASSTAMFVARYTSTGQLDPSFGTSGIATGLAPSGSTTGGANGILALSNGTIVIDGYSGTSTSKTLTLARLSSTGQLDTTFGSSGFAFNSILRYGYQMAQSANGDFLVAGLGGIAGNPATYDFNVAAFLPGGAPDTTFGAGGIATAELPGQPDYSRGLAIQADGNIVVAGYTNPPPGTGGTDLGLARFLPPNTKIGSFTANPNPVTAGNSVTLTAANILNSNPKSTINHMYFYLDTSGDGILDPGSDALLGEGTQTSPGVWTFSFTPTTAGTFTLFALAQDSNNIFSDPLAVALTVTVP